MQPQEAGGCRTPAGGGCAWRIPRSGTRSGRRPAGKGAETPHRRRLFGLLQCLGAEHPPARIHAAASFEARPPESRKHPLARAGRMRLPRSGAPSAPSPPLHVRSGSCPAPRGRWRWGRMRSPSLPKCRFGLFRAGGPGRLSQAEGRKMPAPGQGLPGAHRPGLKGAAGVPDLAVPVRSIRPRGRRSLPGASLSCRERAPAPPSEPRTFHV